MRDRMKDEDKMPFGKYKGERLADVPENYLRWLGEQEWIDEWPRLKAYIEDAL